VTQRPQEMTLISKEFKSDLKITISLYKSKSVTLYRNAKKIYKGLILLMRLLQKASLFFYKPISFPYFSKRLSFPHLYTQE